MGAATLQPLICSNCGARLAAEPDGNVIRCAYCRTEHTFVSNAPPTEKSRGGHMVGEAVLVEWGGKWWNAHVVDVIAAEWKVHYDGWSDQWDEVVSADRIRAAGASPASAPTTPAKRWWIAASLAVVAVGVGCVVWALARADSPAAATPAMTQSASPPGTPIEANAILLEGDPVWGYSTGQWWQAEVVRSMPNGRYEVRYVGWDKKWNESLARDQLRHRR